MIAKLRSESIVVTEVEASGVAFHSPWINAIHDEMVQLFRTVIPEPKPLSEKWISMSVPEEERKKGLNCSAEYYANNARSPVLFYGAMKQIPQHAIVIEVGPHALLEPLIRRNVEKSCDVVGLLIKNSDELTYLFKVKDDFL